MSALAALGLLACGLGAIAGWVAPTRRQHRKAVRWFLVCVLFTIIAAIGSTL